MGACSSLLMANDTLARSTPTICCIWPEMPMPTYMSGVSMSPDTPM